MDVAVKTVCIGGPNAVLTDHAGMISGRSRIRMIGHTRISRRENGGVIGTSQGSKPIGVGEEHFIRHIHVSIL